jgi:hypothetical protein
MTFPPQVAARPRDANEVDDWSSSDDTEDIASQVAQCTGQDSHCTNTEGTT